MFSNPSPTRNRGCTLKELSHRIGLPESTLFRILLTLESRGYLLQNPDGSYSLSSKLLLGRIQERADFVKARLRVYLERLATRFDETATSAYLFEDRVHALDTVDPFIRSMTNKPGVYFLLTQARSARSSLLFRSLH